MIETREKRIEGENYLCTQLPARRALRLKTRLFKLLGPSLIYLYSKRDKKETTKGENAEDVQFFASLCQNLNENEVEDLMMDLLTTVRKNGMELTREKIDLEFAGKFASMFQVAWFVIETNFSDFFLMLNIGSPKDLAENLTSQTELPPESPKNSAKKYKFGA